MNILHVWFGEDSILLGCEVEKEGGWGEVPGCGVSYAHFGGSCLRFKFVRGLSSFLEIWGLMVDENLMIEDDCRLC